MKITVAWNVWSNYADVLLGSEILKKQNDEISAFEELRLISQGGYSEPPTQAQKKYLDAHLNITVDMLNPIVAENPRNIGALRVIGGIKSAYEYSVNKGCDYAIVTNADAWFLDIGKLKKLLASEEIGARCISARVGKTTSIINNFGDYVPFFDDHFIIININRCRVMGIFGFESLKSLNPIFSQYGGFHYMLGAYFEEVVPKGEFYSFTDVNGAMNHYGENIAHTLIPWQLQSEFGFLHVNCAEHPRLHFLRAALLRAYKFDCYPAISDYCKKYLTEYGIEIKIKKDVKIVCYKQKFFSRLKFNFLRLQVNVRQFLTYLFVGHRHKKNKIKCGVAGANSARICFAQRSVVPCGIGMRL